VEGAVKPDLLAHDGLERIDQIVYGTYQCDPWSVSAIAEHAGVGNR